MKPIGFLELFRKRWKGFQRLAILYLLPMVSGGIVSLIGAKFLMIAVFAIQFDIAKISGILVCHVNHLIN